MIRCRLKLRYLPGFAPAVPAGILSTIGNKTREWLAFTGMDVYFNKAIILLPLKTIAMQTSKFVVSGIVGGVVSFFAGYLIYGLALMSFFTANHGTATGVMRASTDMVWWALIAGNLFYGLTISYIFNRWANIRSLGAGLGAGFIIGLLMTAGSDLVMYGTANISNLNGTLVDILCGAVMTAITGAAVGLMNGMGQKQGTA